VAELARDRRSVACGDTMGRLRAFRLAAVLLGSTACSASEGATLSAVATANERSFSFSDGRAFAPSLAARACELTFGALADAGGPATAVAPDVDGTDGFPARIEGQVVLLPAAFQIESSTFDAGAHPELQAGAVLEWSALQPLAGGSLRLTRAADAASSVSAPGRARPNFVVIVTDDQRWDTLDSMPATLARLAARGVSFRNTFVTTPVCGPSRACLLSGGFPARDTGVLTNGGAPATTRASSGNTSTATERSRRTSRPGGASSSRTARPPTGRSSRSPRARAPRRRHRERSSVRSRAT
jgi:hypothetical protein